MRKNERQAKMERRAQLKAELRRERALGPAADQSRVHDLSNELNNLNHELAPPNR